MVLSEWYKAAKTVDQNRATNEAFRSSYHVPSFTLTHPQPCPPVPGIVRPYVHAHTNPSPGNPVPMDIDAAWKKASLPITCYRCRKPGHKSSECNLRFDIRARAIHDSIRGSIWIRTHGFSKSYNLELDPWENPHVDNPSRRLKYLRIYNSTAGHRYSWLPAVRPRISIYLIALHKCYIR